jgi:hypothetical protein
MFQCQASFIHEPSLGPLRNALANWKQIWLLHDSCEDLGVDTSADQEASGSTFDPGAMWKRVGFMRNAPEFWLLAKLVLERLETGRHEEDGTDSLGSGKRSDVPSLGFPVLDKYDETSMSQVNDIITMFQRLNV